MFHASCAVAVGVLVVIGTAAWGAETPTIGLAERTKGPISALAFTGDGRQLVIGSQSGVEVRSWPELKLVSKLETKLPMVRDIAFSPDGQTLAIAGGSPADWGDIELHAWDPRNNSAITLRCAVKAKDTITAIAWSPSGKQLLAASDDKLVRLYDRDLKAVRTFTGHSRPVSAVAWIGGEDQLLSAGYDQSVRLWKVDQEIPTRTLDQHTGAVHGLAIDPVVRSQPPWLASCAADKTVRFWQPTIGRMVRFVKLPTVPQVVRWLPDGSQLVVVGTDGKLRMISPDSAAITLEEKATAGWSYALAVHPSGQWAAVGGEHGEVVGVRLLRTDEGERR